MAEKTVRVQLPVGWESSYSRAGVPEKYARSAYVEYCDQGHGGQSFERVQERGGFGVFEIMLLLCERIQRLEGGLEHKMWKTGLPEALEAERKVWTE